MFSWIGANSRGNVTAGIGFRLGSGGQGPQNGCMAQGLGCVGMVLALVAILVVIRLTVIFVEGMLRAG